VRGYDVANILRRYDVIVIGSGAGGATAALRLCQGGAKVLLVERGDFLAPPIGLPAGQIGAFLSDVCGSRQETLSFVGGQTKFYGAALYRFRKSDFAERRHESGISPAWPVSYEKLEPYYAEAERIYKVHGAVGGDPSEPPRRESYPHPPLPHAPFLESLIERLRISGVPVAALPRGLDHGPGGKCVLCPTCDAHLCCRDAKMDAEIAAIRPALATGNLDIATLTECLRITLDPSSRHVAGVLLRRGGEVGEVQAGNVIVAAGLPQTALLLRRSRTGKHPEGLGNSSGSLGRHLAGHATGMLFPIISISKVPPMHTKTFAINAFYDGAPDWPYPLGVVQVAGQAPYWKEAPRHLRPMARLLARHSLLCFYMTEALPSRETGLTFRGDEIACRTPPIVNQKTFEHMRKQAVSIFRRAGYPVLARKRAPYIWHETGTACMGEDPANSVVDPRLMVHGVAGLYVADASVLPSAGAVNTGLTIMALALRAADDILERTTMQRRSTQELFRHLSE